ncbi:glycosyltransferase family 2 protein [Brachyspira intermedia]|uniref:glycosyltransferase family 2 protein n=1 Tax=Brachyspira intermedia TaxID=84377 RepID=UPI003004AE07
MNNFISVIIPVYNAEKYIEKCLISLMNQTYKNIEIICVNDGSTDNSYSLLEKFSKQDTRIKIFSHENSGPAKTRNVGLENSTGDYIMFCDADDYYSDNMCELMLTTLLNENVDFVSCSTNVIDYFDSKFRKPTEFVYYNVKHDGKHLINEYPIFDFNFVIWNKIFKKSILDKYSIKFPIGFEHDDSNFVLKYVSVSKSYYGLDIKLYNYQIININSIMNLFFLEKTNNNKRLDFVYSYNDVMLFVINNNLSKNIANYILSYYIGIVLHYGTQYINGNKELKKLINVQKDFWKDINIFDGNWYIDYIKNKPLKECIKLYKIKLTKLEWIFSIKNRSEHEKLITILGFQIRIKRR